MILHPPRSTRTVSPAPETTLFRSDVCGASGKNLPGDVLANTRLDWKDIGGSVLTLGVYVRNLFGERYFTSPAVLLKSVPVNSVYVGEPRTWGVTGRFNF